METQWDGSMAKTLTELSEIWLEAHDETSLEFPGLLGPFPMESFCGLSLKSSLGVLNHILIYFAFGFWKLGLFKASYWQSTFNL